VDNGVNSVYPLKGQLLKRFVFAYVLVSSKRIKIKIDKIGSRINSIAHINGKCSRFSSSSWLYFRPT